MPKKTKQQQEEGQQALQKADVLNFDEAVAFLKTTRPTMYRWIAQGKVKGFKAGRQWRFYRRDLQKFLEYDEPTTAGIDLDAVYAAIKILDDRIAKANKANQPSDKQNKKVKKGVGK